MAYALISDMLLRYDPRICGDLCSDDGTRVSPTDLLTNATLQAALDDASGMIDSAVLVSERYSPLDLANLTGIDKNFLTRLTVDLTYIFLYQRRGKDDVSKLPQYQRVMDELDRLRQGLAVFNVPANLDAGKISSGFISLLGYENLNLERDYAHRIFPARLEQLPTGHGGTSGTTPPTLPFRIDSHYGIITLDPDNLSASLNCTTSDKHLVILTGNPVLALTNDFDGQVIVVILQQDATGSRTVTWFPGILWADGTAPTLTTTPDKQDVFSFLRKGAGNYLGFVVSQDL